MGFDVAVNVVISWNDEEAIRAQRQMCTKVREERAGLIELVVLSSVRSVAGKENKVDLAFFVEQSFQISLPGRAKNPTPTPSFFLARASYMKVGDVKKSKGVLAESHDSLAVYQSAK